MPLKVIGQLFLIYSLLGCNGSGTEQFTELPPLQDRYELSSTVSVPEGVTFDPIDRRFYAGSLQGGTIVSIGATGDEQLFHQATDTTQFLGMKVDSQSRRLWACARSTDTNNHRVVVFDLISAQILLTFSLGSLAVDGSCNDLTLAPGGIAYVTDSGNPNVYKLDSNSELGEILVSDPLFDDITGIGLGLNGIALIGDTLVTGMFLPSQLFTIDLAQGTIIQPIELTGDSLPSPDGLIFLNGNLYSVANSSVSQIVLDEGLSSGRVSTRTVVDGLSTATIAEDELYVIKSDVFNFVFGQPLDTPFEIIRVNTRPF